MSSHPEKSAHFLKNEPRVDWHDAALWFVREKRDRAASSVEEWEELRNAASQIKENVLSHLSEYLEQFEKKAVNNGVVVHWANDANALNQIVTNILQAKNIQQVVKSKSMLTEECKLNDHLEQQQIEVVDTDLGERIIQLRGEHPSHIVLPAIHLKKEEVGTLFHEKFGTEAGASDPQYLTEAARQHLREKFLVAEAAITGVNFAIAETGGVTICTNEGNADVGVNLAPIQIHCMGMEKIIPRAQDLGVFTGLLAKSATGQPITIYTSHYHRPKPEGEMHVIILDNGRSEHLGKEAYRNSMKCIRCGACMNTCPIYRRSGGHSYNATVPGPIGSILNPARKIDKHWDLPFASTLCGSCADVCPVKIDIHEQLYKWRQDIYDQKLLPIKKRWFLASGASVLSSPKRFAFAGRWMRRLLRYLPKTFIYNPWNVWGKARDLPDAPKESFKEWYHKNRR